MGKHAKTAVVIILSICTGHALAADVAPVCADEAAHWVHYTVPLPKEIVITSKVTLDPQQVNITTQGNRTHLLRQAALELAMAMKKEVLSGNIFQHRDPAFTIIFNVGGPEAAELKTLKNADQAYRIVPDAAGQALRVNALTERGAYYGSKTLQQLLQTAGDQVTLPMVKVTDWPDVGTRGVWGVDASSQVRWLSDRKYNYMEQIATSRINDEKKAVARLAGFKQRMVEDGPVYGISPVPVILHLEQISGAGLFTHYPELKGKGEAIHKGAICYSNPLFVDILADWIVGYLGMDGVEEVDVWLAENLQQKPGCQCEQCKNANRDVLELRAVLAAWDKAKKRKPNARLAVLTSEETADSNTQLLAMLPADIRFWYYHSLLTYNTSEVPMVPPFLAQAGREGRNVGVCLNLSPHSTTYQPMTSPQFIHYRMTEFADKKMAGMLGYPTPAVAYYRFNTEAAAEWCWNARGRSPREFAYSYAIRQGVKDPDLFTEWALAEGEVAWDVYGSEWPAGEKRAALGNVTHQLRDGKLPELGEVLWEIYPKPWGDIKTVEQLKRDKGLAERALQIARQLDDAAILHETLVVKGYLQSLASLWALKQLVTPQGVAEKDKGQAQRHFQEYVDALDQAKDNLVQWETALRDRARAHYVRGVCELLDRMIQDMTGVAAELGFTLEEK